MAITPTGLTRRPGHRIAVLAFDGMSPFETAIVVEVFGLPRPELDVDWYELAVCAADPGPLRTVGGLTLTAPFGLDAFAAADPLAVPGVPDVHATGPAPVARPL